MEEPTAADDPPAPVPATQRMRSVASSRLWLWRIWSLIGAAVLLVGVWWLLREPLAVVLPPLALAAVIVYLLNPIVGGLKRLGVPRAIGAALAYVLLLAGLVALVAVVGPVVATQTGELLERLPEISEELQAGINRQLRRLGIDARVTIDLQRDTTQRAIEQYLADNRDTVLNVIRGAGTVLGRLLHGLLTLVLAPILAFYILADMPRMVEGIERLVPPGPRLEVVEVAGRIGRTVGGYFRGQLLVAAFVGIATSIGLSLIGLPFWALVGPIAGVFNLVPLVGPFVGGTIGVIIALTVGDGGSQAVWVVVVMTAVQQIDNHVITPNIVARTVRVHPLTVILALLVAGSLYGLLGMFVAIPLIAAVKLVVMYLLVTRVASMRHLAGEGPGLFDESDPPAEPRDGTLLALGREMRRTWERRRDRDGNEGATQAASRTERADSDDSAGR